MKWLIIGALSVGVIVVLLFALWWWYMQKRTESAAPNGENTEPWDLKLDGFIPQSGKPLKNRPPTESEVAKLEEIIGAKLPSDYRAFLLKCNGFQFADSMWMEFADADERAIEEWQRYLHVDELYHFSVDPGEFGGLLGIQSSYPFGTHLRAEFLVIGSVPWSGGQICLGITESMRGKVYYEPGGSDPYDSPQSVRAGMRYVAPSFRNMWNVLRRGRRLEEQ